MRLSKDNLDAVTYKLGPGIIPLIKGSRQCVVCEEWTLSKDVCPHCGAEEVQEAPPKPKRLRAKNKQR